MQKRTIIQTRTHKIRARNIGSGYRAASSSEGPYPVPAEQVEGPPVKAMEDFRQLPANITWMMMMMMMYEC